MEKKNNLKEELKQTMTDEQKIMQGLEAHAHGSCVDCPYHHHENCSIDLADDSMQLIQRLKQPDCFCTDKVPVTDCEGGEEEKPRELKDSEGNIIGYIIKCEHSPDGECLSFINFEEAREDFYTYCDTHGYCCYNHYPSED